MSYTTYAELVKQHGTLEDFTEAVRKAVGDISLDEAEKAIADYKFDLDFAKTQDAKFGINEEQK